MKAIKKPRIYKLNSLFRPVYMYGRRVWSPIYYTYNTLRKNKQLLNSPMHKLTPGLDTWLFTDRWPIMYKRKHFIKKKGNQNE